MPLQHIQLRPRKTLAPEPVIGAKRQPALARRLAQDVRPYAGPTPALGELPPLQYPALARPTARAPLERALAGGPAPDVQAEAWARREEIVAEEQARLNAEADALYGAVQDLSKKDQDYLLSRVVGKGRKDVGALGAALGAEPGVISPAAIRTDPLMQTMIDKHYIRLDENGQTYSWMLPEPDKKYVETIIDPQSGEMITRYADGSMERTGMFTDLAPEVEEPKLSEQVSLARLHFDIEKYGQSNVEAATKELGPPPVIGASMRAPGTNKYRKVKQEDIERYYTALEDLSDYIKVSREGPQTMGDLEALYRNRPDEVKIVQQQLGLEPTGVWSDELAQKLFEIFSGEE